MSLSFSHGYILHTRHFFVAYQIFFLAYWMLFVAYQKFLLQDSYHMTITMVIFCKQKGMDTLFCLFLYYFVMVTYLNHSDIIYRVATFELR